MKLNQWGQIQKGYDDGIYSDGIGNASFGLRPVVCLPSDITAQWNPTNQVWNLQKK